MIICSVKVEKILPFFIRVYHLCIIFQVQSIQLPKDDRQDRMKGFGYIEFKDKSNLIAALQQGELVSAAH